MKKPFLLCFSIAWASILSGFELKEHIIARIKYYDVYEVVSTSDTILKERFVEIGEDIKVGMPLYKLSRIDSPKSDYIIKSEESEYRVIQTIDTFTSNVGKNETILKAVKPNRILLNLNTTFEKYLKLQSKQQLDLKFFPNSTIESTQRLKVIKISQLSNSNSLVNIEIKLICHQELCEKYSLSGQLVEVLI